MIGLERWLKSYEETLDWEFRPRSFRYMELRKLRISRELKEERNNIMLQEPLYHPIIAMQEYGCMIAHIVDDLYEVMQGFAEIEGELFDVIEADPIYPSDIECRGD